MSKIKNLQVSKDKTIEVEMPDLEGFIVTVAYIPREELLKMRNQALVLRFNKRTRQKEEEVDNDKFLELYAGHAIRGWKGLKIKHLPSLLPVDIQTLDPDEVIVYSPEEALDLLKNSAIFDQFITDTINDLEAFSVKKKDTNIKN